MSESIVDADMPQLTHRERFRRLMHYQKVDRIPHWEFGYLDETVERWHAEGLPEQYGDNPSIETYFGVEPVAYVPFHDGLLPPFGGKVEVLEEKEWSRIEKLPDRKASRVDMRRPVVQYPPKVVALFRRGEQGGQAG